MRRIQIEVFLVALKCIHLSIDVQCSAMAIELVDIKGLLMHSYVGIQDKEGIDRTSAVESDRLCCCEFVARTLFITRRNGGTHSAAHHYGRNCFYAIVECVVRGC